MERGTVLAVTFSDLLFRFRQFLIAIIGVTLVLALALLLSGLASGFTTEVSQTVGGFGADTWVLSKAAGGRITAFVAFPESDDVVLGDASGVHDTSPVLLIPLQVAHDGTTQLTVNLVGVVPGKLGDPAATEGHDSTGQIKSSLMINSALPLARCWCWVGMSSVWLALSGTAPSWVAPR